MTAPAAKTKAAAITQAWRVLATRWPRRFAPARLDDVMRRTWERGLLDCAIDALVPAAEQLVAVWQGPAPDVPDVAKQARLYEAKHLRATLPSLGPMSPKPPRQQILDVSRRFWIERVDGHGEPYRAVCWVLPDGLGSVGISEAEMDRLLAGHLAWGWLDR